MALRRLAICRTNNKLRRQMCAAAPLVCARVVIQASARSDTAEQHALGKVSQQLAFSACLQVRIREVQIAPLDGHNLIEGDAPRAMDRRCDLREWSQGATVAVTAGRRKA